MRIFTNLRWLQLIDAALLSIMLGVIAMLLWFSLSDISSEARLNQQTATTALQAAKTAFLQQIALETQIDAQREAYESLDEAFFKFANNPNSDREQLPHLHELAAELLAEYQNLTTVWPANTEKQLREQLEELTGIMAGLAQL